MQDIQQQLGILNLRINDMMEQINKVVKAYTDEIAELRAELAKAQPMAAGEVPAAK
jgi:hypothetical protein